MSRLFTAASSEFAEYAGADVTAYPFTTSLWFYPLDTGVAETFWSIATSGSDNNFWEMGPNATDKTRFRSRVSSNVDVTTANTHTQNAWNHVVITATSATDRKIILNGSTEAQTTTSSSPSGMNRTTLGRKSTSTLPQYFNGRLAEQVTWNVALDAAEKAALAKGISPLEVRPASIVSIRHMFGNESPEPDYHNRNELTLTGTAHAVDHPRIFY
jgi:hypothetical protein